MSFFSRGIWEDMSRSLLAIIIDKLRSWLNKVLLRPIAAEPASMIDEIEIQSSACRNRLDKIGEPRVTLAEQRVHLVHLSQSFQSLLKAVLDGTYNDPFFGDAKSEPGYRKRIQAVIQNRNRTRCMCGRYSGKWRSATHFMAALGFINIIDRVPIHLVVVFISSEC